MTPYRFNRMEFAGSLGDLGTLLPMAIGMILINGLDPMGVFFSVGIFFILSGIYFGVTAPVQPMKVIGAYAIATAMPPGEILASGAIMGLMLLVIGGTNAITLIGRYVPQSVIRGVQLSTGVLLMTQGVRFIIGTSRFQLLRDTAEPYLTCQSLGPIQIGIIIGILSGVITLLLLDNRRFPAALCVVAGGILTGLIIGTGEGLDKVRFGWHLPSILPFGLPARADFAVAFFTLALPQLPMTLGNAVIANGDLSQQYFGQASARVTYRALTLSMALANGLSFLIGGMPLCHGAGGLAAHYRFGARTAGSNLYIGAIFLMLALLFGAQALAFVYLIPMSVLGILLLFAGSQLAMTMIDLQRRKDLFVSLLMVGITLAANLAFAFAIGIGLAWLLRAEKLSV